MDQMRNPEEIEDWDSDEYTEDILDFASEENRPLYDALLKALNCIANLGLNMSRIESRPSKRELGEYVFFIDLDLNKKHKICIVFLHHFLVDLMLLDRES